MEQQRERGRKSWAGEKKIMDEEKIRKIIEKVKEQIKAEACPLVDTKPSQAIPIATEIVLKNLDVNSYEEFDKISKIVTGVITAELKDICKNKDVIFDKIMVSISKKKNGEE